MSQDHLVTWRDRERRRLIDLRGALPGAVRAEHDRQIRSLLQEVLPEVRGLTIAGYWPIRGEPDIRPFLHRLAEAGAIAALPAVDTPASALVFRAWKREEPLVRDLRNLPAPASTMPTVQPDVLLIPVVGFDSVGFRLGYGGGYFDRTLAEASARPRAIGVGYSVSRMPTVRPQPHDVPMDLIVTEAGISNPTREGSDTA